MNHPSVSCSGLAVVPNPVLQHPHVVLISLNWARDKDPRLPLGHASLLATLKAAGRSVDSLVFAVNDGLAADDIAARILEIKDRQSGRVVDLGIGAYVWGEPTIQALLPELRRRGFGGRIILGGPQISFMESGFEEKYPDADIFVRGSGEEALLAINSSIEPITLAGVLYAGCTSQVTSAASNLEALPSPWLGHDWEKEPLKFVRLETMRGCPYSCSFCQHRAPKQGPRLNYLAASRIMQEIDLFCRKEVESVAVLDPIFNVSPVASEVLKAFVERGFRGRISLQCRAERITTEFLAAASQLNVTLEFGLQTIHAAESTAVNRHNKIAEVDRALSEVRRLGIHHEVSLIFGLPNQTLASFQQTVEWCLNRHVPVIKAFPLMLLRGTQLELDAPRWNLKQSKDAIPIVVSSTTFDESDWKEMNAISAALRLSEGHHPKSIDGLTAGLVSTGDVHRWSPLG